MALAGRGAANPNAVSAAKAKAKVRVLLRNARSSHRAGVVEETSEKTRAGLIDQDRLRTRTREHRARGPLRGDRGTGSVERAHAEVRIGRKRRRRARDQRRGVIDARAVAVRKANRAADRDHRHRRGESAGLTVRRLNGRVKREIDVDRLRGGPAARRRSCSAGRAGSEHRKNAKCQRSSNRHRATASAPERTSPISCSGRFVEGSMIFRNAPCASIRYTTVLWKSA